MPRRTAVNSFDDVAEQQFRESCKSNGFKNSKCEVLACKMLFWEQGEPYHYGYSPPRRYLISVHNLSTAFGVAKLLLEITQTASPRSVFPRDRRLRLTWAPKMRLCTLSEMQL